MSFFSLVLVGLAMSTDAFAAAITNGAMLTSPRIKYALKVGFIFGIAEAIMPIIGWLLGQSAAVYIQYWDHWIAFILLGMMGILLVRNSFIVSDKVAKTAVHSLWLLSLTALATSIDALMIGISFAFIELNILVAAAVIGIATLFMSTLGIMLGHIVGGWVGKRAELVGGMILIIIAALILYQHLSE